MIKKIFFIVFIGVCVSVSKGHTQEIISHKPTHTIFLIHGIGGNKTHFGYMSRALPAILNKKDLSTNYVARSIEYDTGDNEKTPYEFAKDINLEIKKITDSENFQDKDKFSFIMHSQGGLITAIWIFQSLMSTPGYSVPETIEHLDAFITLGSPFWGAKTAKWADEIKSLANQLGADVPLPFGKRELEEMSFGSDMIFDFRIAMIDPQYKPLIDYLRSHVRFLNIVGVADLLNPLGIFVSGTGKYEDDGAVPLSSARFNFLHSQSIKDDYEDGDKTKIDNVKEINMAPYVMVNAMHRSPLPELDNFAGIAQIPEDCINNEKCKHPTFPYLWNHILGNKIEQLDDTLGGFKTFLLDLNVRVASNNEYACEDLTIELQKPDGSPIKKSNIEILKFYELYSQGRRSSQKYPNHCRFYFTGSIKNTVEGHDEAVLIKLSGDKVKTRFVEMKLRESYSSFVDVNLIKADMK